MAAEPIYIDLDDDTEIATVQNVRQVSRAASEQPVKDRTHQGNILSFNDDSIILTSDDDSIGRRASHELKEHHLEFLDLLGVPANGYSHSKELSPTTQEYINIEDDEEENANVYIDEGPIRSTHRRGDSDIICLDDDEQDGGENYETPNHSLNYTNQYEFPASSPTIDKYTDMHSENEKQKVTERILESDKEDDGIMMIRHPTSIPARESDRTRTSYPTLPLRTLHVSDKSSIILSPIKPPQNKKRRRSSSSIGPVTVMSPTIKRNSATTLNSTNNYNVLNLRSYNGSMKATTALGSSARDERTSRSSTNGVFDAQRPSRVPSSDLSDFSSSLNEIRVDNVTLGNEDLRKGTEAIRTLKKQKLNRARNLKIDLARERANMKLPENSKVVHSVHNDMNSIKPVPTNSVRDDTCVDDFSNISNSSTDMHPPTNFMKNVLDSMDKYSEERLELLFQRTKDIEPSKLKNANKLNYNKEELTAMMTCKFSSTLDENLKVINADYCTHITTVKFGTFADKLPLIKFQRHTDSLFYKKRNSFVPIPPEQIEEKFIVLVYEAKELIPLFKDKTLREEIKLVKRKYPGYKLGVWFLGYRDYMQKLKTEYNRSVQKEVQARLNSLNPEQTPSTDEGDPKSTRKRKSKKPDEPPNQKIRPQHIEERIRKYEVEYQVYFELFKGLKEMVFWLKAYAYTLSCKHIDVLEKNSDVANIGRIPSKMNPRDAAVGMLAQLKGLKEEKAKRMVEKQDYQCIADIYRDVLKNVDFSGERLLNSNHDILIKKLLTSKNPQEKLT
jgi:hypothetical protein